MDKLTKKRTGSALLYSVAFILLVLGVASLVIRDLPPHLIDFLGWSQDQVDPKLVQVVFMLIKIIGVLYLAIAATVVVLTSQGLHRNHNGDNNGGKNGARMALGTLLLPFLFIPLITLPAGFGPPMLYVPVILVCTVTALYMVRNQT